METTDVTYHKIRHLQTLEEPESNLINVIYKLMYLKFEILELFPSRLASHINKLVHSHRFIYFICKSRGKQFPYFKLKVD